jgi:uncharacterized protein (DUF1697 family)
VSRHVAFLRGINLGKSRRVKNEQLRVAFEQLGLDSVATFRASGNVIFEAAEARDLAARVEAGLAEELGFEVTVFLRSARQVAAIAAHQPFGAERVGAAKGRLQVALLPSGPSPAVRKKALALALDGDPLAIRGSELYWLPSAGTLDSDLDLKALEALVGPWSMRTMGTIEQIAAKHCG